MGQLNFEQNFEYFFANMTANAFSIGSVLFAPLNVRESISLINVHINPLFGSSANQTKSFYLGLYSLSGSILSIVNSLSVTISTNDGRSYMPLLSFSNTSATQNVTPGTWFLGILASTAGRSELSLLGRFTASPDNAFPGAFIGGLMTETTNALPSSMAISNLDITGRPELSTPYILLTT